MFNSVAIDVFIGLFLIFSLYSLLATILVEMLATFLAIRARNLKEVINRMLNDQARDDRNLFLRLVDSLKLLRNPDNPIINNFYNYPEIKYLGSNGLFKNPSSFQAISFSKTLLYLLNGSGELNRINIDAELRSVAPKVLGPETTNYILSLWEDSHGDIVRFKAQLETWFNRSMEQALEWYKRKIQVLLVITGFILAWIFNVDAIHIASKLSNDKDARAQMVTLAAAYIEKHNTDSGAFKSTGNIDSLNALRQQLQIDIDKANSIMGLGGYLPDSIKLEYDSAKKTLVYPNTIEPDLLPARVWQITKPSVVSFRFSEQLNYMLAVLSKHFFGFIITALAISLGAPFWFDLLNKLMQLRTSVKVPTKPTNGLTNNDNSISPENRVG